MKRIIVLSLALMVSALSTTLEAGLKLPSIIGNHMVLQRDLANPIWGWADPGAKVSLSIAGQHHEAEAGEDGRWVVKLDPMKGSNHALRMTIQSGSERVILSNIVVGEVWLASGQSNMQWAVSQSDDPELEIVTANFPNIRIITVPQIGSNEALSNFNGQWDIVTPETIGDFSAIAYFFGRQIHQTLGIPVGLIDNAWGGSAAEAWVTREALVQDGRFDDVIARWDNIDKTYNYDAVLAKWQEDAKKAKAEGKAEPRRPGNLLTGNARPGNLWNGVLNPVIGYGIKGSIWYQGESNASRAFQYEDLFSLMITEWRRAWDQGDFPFYWVQLADFKAETKEPGDSDWAELREAQTNVLSLPNTGQAVIIDLGEARDIHPRDKQNVAKRLARIALAKDYGFTSLNYLSPSYESLKINENKALLKFKNVGGGLYTFDVQEAVGFAVAGEDKVWHWATGKLVGNDQIEVSSPAVEKPVAVRYAWSDNPVANVRSKEGLPLDPFRTDDWPRITEPKPAPAQ